ncbi:hypothetical protein FDECE_8529 [Fusarium decemcellulare]|nr:hypothetical protein FDECE_8529 [Fusarium decemcellulare]
MGESQTIRHELRQLKVLQGLCGSVDFDAFPTTPHDAFIIWLREAIAADVKEPHAMTLSTVDKEGRPDARVLILKNVDDCGFHFAVKSTSPKGVQIASQKHVALTFYWPEQGRQVRIRGAAIRRPDQDCKRDFLDRPLESRISATASKQSQVLRDKAQLLEAVSSTRHKLEADPDFVLPGWEVYAVEPVEVEFWQGACDRLHQRLQYVAGPEAGTWRKQVLWP